MKTASRKLVALLGTIIVLGVIGALLIQGPREEPQNVVLSDGTVIVLRGSTVGTNHVHGNLLARAVRRLPDKLRQPLVEFAPSTLHLNEFSGRQQFSLMVWLKAQVQQPPNFLMVSLAPVGRPPSMMIHNAGFGKVYSDGTGFLGVSPFEVWPRRVDQFECLLFEAAASGGFREAGRLRVWNPAVSTVPEWQPEPLPATRTEDGMVFVLQEFTAGIGRGRNEFFGGNGSYTVRFLPQMAETEAGAIIRYEVRSTDPGVKTWSVSNAWLSDATGNRLNPTLWYNWGGWLQSLGPVLWPDEAAWKLTLELRGRRNSAPEVLTRVVEFLVAPNWLQGTNGVGYAVERVRGTNGFQFIIGPESQ